MDRMSGQPAISALRASAFPSPHHASGTPASEILCPKEPMQARKESSKGRVEQAISVARIDSIEGDDPSPPSYAYHRAPHIVLGVLLEYEHFILLVECRARLVEPSRRVRCAMWCRDASGHSRWNVQFVPAPSFEIC